MPHLQLSIDIGARDPVPYEDALLELGALSVTLEDAADDPVLEPAPGEMPLWPTVIVKALFDASADPARLTQALQRMVSDAPSPHFEHLEDRAWEREWLRDFRPMRFGKRLWVCPGGLPAGDSDGLRIELDPGLAFGTGTHPTTALCLEWLDSAEIAQRDVIDYGCGSGILAVAAARLGASSVLAVDIDPQAVTATRQNAERNSVGDRITATTEPELRAASADLLVANILATPLVSLAGRFGSATRERGSIALSGILVEQSNAVTAAYRPWFDIALSATRDGWALLTGARRAN